MTLGSIRPKKSYSKQFAISAAGSVQLLCYELELMQERGVPFQCHHSMQWCPQGAREGFSADVESKTPHHFTFIVCLWFFWVKQQKHVERPWTVLTLGKLECHWEGSARLNQGSAALAYTESLVSLLWDGQCWLEHTGLAVPCCHPVSLQWPPSVCAAVKCCSTQTYQNWSPPPAKLCLWWICIMYWEGSDHFCLNTKYCHSC